jgi:hypothetical protein
MFPTADHDAKLPEKLSHINSGSYSRLRPVPPRRGELNQGSGIDSLTVPEGDAISCRVMAPEGQRT